MCLCKGEKYEHREHGSLGGAALRGQSPWDHEALILIIRFFMPVWIRAKKNQPPSFILNNSVPITDTLVRASKRIFQAKREALQLLPLQTCPLGQA